MGILHMVILRGDIVDWIVSCPKNVVISIIFTEVLLLTATILLTKKGLQTPQINTSAKGVVTQEDDWVHLSDEEVPSQTLQESQKERCISAASQEEEERMRSNSSIASGVESLRKVLPPESKSDKLLTDDMCARFLIARNGNVNAARAMYDRWISFRTEYQLDEIHTGEISGMINKKVAYWRGKDHLNRPCCIVIPRRNWPKSPPTEIIRFTMHLLNEGVTRADDPKTNNPGGQLSIIYDRTGMTMKQFDYKLFGIVRKIVDMIQICYAERLGVIYILGANWFYHKMFAVISILLTKKTKSKIKLLSKHTELLEWFDEDMVEHVINFVKVDSVTEKD